MRKAKSSVAPGFALRVWRRVLVVLGGLLLACRDTNGTRSRCAMKLTTL